MVYCAYEFDTYNSPESLVALTLFHIATHILSKTLLRVQIEYKKSKQAKEKL